VTRGQLPQRAGLPGLNGGGAATAVPPHPLRKRNQSEALEVPKENGEGK